MQRTHFAFSLAATLVFLSLAGCKKQQCETISYDARSLSARVKLPQQLGGAEGSIETTKNAIREVDNRVEKYFAQWKTACLDYNNEALTREEYRDETNRIRQSMERLDELAMRLEKAGSTEEFDALLRDTYLEATGAEGKAVGVSVQFLAMRPGDGDFKVAPAGATLATKTKVKVAVTLDTPAHVYIYQITPSGTRNTLFPIPQIPFANPLPAGQELVIPPNGSFELDDKDLGYEDVHVIASASPLEGGAEGVSTGSKSASPEASCKTRGLNFVADDCPKSRGLVFAADPAAASGGGGDYSLKGLNRAAEDAVHLVYTFHHVASLDEQAQRPAGLSDDFGNCPAGAVAKEMASSDGGFARWCVANSPGGQLVDHGPYRKWYGSGTLWVKGELNMGSRVGTWQTYDQGGGLVSELAY